MPLETQAAETSVLRRRPAPRLVSHDFVDADLVDVIKVYIGPGVEGSVTARFDSVAPEHALAWVLKKRGDNIRYKLIGYNTLIVAGGAKVDQIENEIYGKSFGPRPVRGAIRQEFQLKKAPAAKVIGFLQGQYKEVEFIPHPTLNGFYAVGSRKDGWEIRNLLPELDKAL